MLTLLDWIFLIDVLALFGLLIGVVWSVAFPEKRIWPPPSKNSWQHILSWVLFYLAFGLNFLLIVLDWNTWQFNSPLRFIIGVPCVVVGSLLLVWGIRSLGTGNTSGVAEGFKQDGPYRFTRNPQYLGDFVLFLGLSIVTNSLYLWIAHILLIFIFVIAPISEEDWLKEQYGEAYQSYFDKTARFL